MEDSRCLGLRFPSFWFNLPLIRTNRIAAENSNSDFFSFVLSSWSKITTERYSMMFASREWYSNLGLPLLDVVSTVCLMLCPIACEKLQATRAGFEPATPAFKCRRYNHLTTELVQVVRQIQTGIAVGTATLSRRNKFRHLTLPFSFSLHLSLFLSLCRGSAHCIGLLA